ncbi:MAG: hypothetical protein HZA20_11400 [Nitrospirae bacterium]|nr:hypothetical protein [Nitrospirota bacterium]
MHTQVMNLNSGMFEKNIPNRCTAVILLLYLPIVVAFSKAIGKHFLAIVAFLLVIAVMILAISNIEALGGQSIDHNVNDDKLAVTH